MGLCQICVSHLCRFYGKPGTFTIDSWVLAHSSIEVRRCLPGTPAPPGHGTSSQSEDRYRAPPVDGDLREPHAA